MPFVFVYSPSFLLVAKGFSPDAFILTLAGAMIGIAGIGVAFTGYLIAPLKMLERWYVGLVSLLFIAPGFITMAIGIAAFIPIILLQKHRQSALSSESEPSDP